MCSHPSCALYLTCSCASRPSCSICCSASSVSFSTFFRASHSSCSTSFVLHLPLSLWCSRARHILLTSGVSFPIYTHGSHLLALMYRVSCVLVFQISEFFSSLDYGQSLWYSRKLLQWYCYTWYKSLRSTNLRWPQHINPWIHIL